MKYHKIKNIPLEVCTAEAVIAYNICFNWLCLIDKKKYAISPAFNKAEARAEFINFISDKYKDYDGFKKYNFDAIICCIRAGLDEYINYNNSGILCNYSEIGNIFKSLYLDIKYI